jgi:hypothetical protein
MTAVERVRRTQRFLGAAAITRAIAWGIATALVMLAGEAFIGMASPEFERAASRYPGVPAVLGLIVAAALLWRSRMFMRADRVALWIEECVPALHYSLVTAMEHGSSPFAAGMEAVVSRENITGVTWASLRKSLLLAIGAVATAALLLYISPAAALTGSRLIPGLGGSRAANAIPVGSRLNDIEALVTPPAYTGQGASTIEDPSSVTGLVGSRVLIRGSGSPQGITASIGNNAEGVGAAPKGWAVSFTMPAKPAALTMKDRQYDRIIVLDPRADNPPRIALTSPARDSTLRAAQLVVHLDATVTDDIGLNAGYFEYLVTTGSGELFSARTITTPPVHFNGARSGNLSATLSLADLKLGQGDVVSIRAIAQDVNTLTGPGLATSDTRTFRIARADEYDSVAVDPAAPLPVDTAAMSQRMLIIATEKLVKDRPKIQRKELVSRSGQIGDLEDKIRKRVEEVLYELDGGEEEADPSAAPDPSKTLEGEESDEGRAASNPDLLEAFNELWSAVRSLQIAEPDSALPHMRIALKALDRARLANRLYLRGMPPKVIVDVARVRMTGKEKGAANVRTPRTAQDSARVELSRRFSDAVELLATKPQEAARALSLMQVQALTVSPQLAAALGEAVDAFRKGRDATLPLLRARRALEGNPESSSGLPAWSGAR